ncbi:hypothetical protein HJC23_012839 [Cyclotella cryptica]|uniref:GST C-terminal domain-containing protein n=1 Tax=Cyclotella cryptica TaxID=29204 RepID=A0ABD3Q276_9STRA|eukprot:CCRYP_009411-RA/>CCRYP_009411-RA protein AED:0.25 eAED:0.25 QI:553/1/1/1/1/1/2/1576/368
MDCLCCVDGGRGPNSDTEFLGSVCNLNNGEAKFPAENGRYVMHVVAGCPFAARPWSVLSFYGIPTTSNTDGVRVVKMFPASHTDGWFFSPISAGEKELVESFPDANCDTLLPTPKGCYPPNDTCFPPCKDGEGPVHHISQLYEIAKPGFSGVKSVPLLWDTKTHTAVSNSSLGLSEMIATQLVPTMGTRNLDVALYPSRSNEKELYQEHDELVKMLNSRVTTAVYKINATNNGREHDRLVNEYYDTLDELQLRIQKNGGYLMGNTIRFADIILFISLVRLDLAYQWRFGLGRRSIRDDYPGLLKYMTTILNMEGMLGECVLPRDIMALYFMTPKWVALTAGKTLPQVPESWEKVCVDDACERKDSDRD